jgi:hypothetical protein
MGMGLVLGPDTSPYFVTPSLRHFTSYGPTANFFKTKSILPYCPIAVSP